MQHNMLSQRKGCYAMKKYKYRKVITIEGKKYQIYADTLTELGKKIAQKEQEVKSGSIIVSGNTTLDKWAEQCIATYKSRQKENTRAVYVRRVRHCILDHIGMMRLQDIKPMHCQQVLNLQAGKSKTQINEVYQAFRFLFKHALDNELIVRDPTTALIKPAGTRHSRRALTKAEREAFIAVGKTDRRYYFYLLMIFCGCRPSEAAGCTGRDIVIKNGYPMLHIRGTKTSNADRFVPIPEELFELIKNTPKSEYIAQYSNGNKIKEEHRARLWNSYTRQINIFMGCKTYRNALVPPYPLAPDLVAYCLRHEYCTDLARRGIDIRIAQKLMGHSDIKLTANIYTNYNNDDLAEVAELLFNNDSASADLAK